MASQRRRRTAPRSSARSCAPWKCVAAPSSSSPSSGYGGRGRQPSSASKPSRPSRRCTRSERRRRISAIATYSGRGGARRRQRRRPISPPSDAYRQARRTRRRLRACHQAADWRRTAPSCERMARQSSSMAESSTCSIPPLRSTGDHWTCTPRTTRGYSRARARGRASGCSRRRHGSRLHKSQAPRRPRRRRVG